MDKEKLIARFESEMAKVKRPGIDKLMDYIRKSDFYAAPASTKFHLSCEGGLLAAQPQRAGCPPGSASGRTDQ